MRKVDVRLKNRWGMHARLAYRFAAISGGFKAVVTVSKGATAVSGKEIMDLLSLGAGPGAGLTISAEGEDETAAVETLAQFLDAAPHEI